MNILADADHADTNNVWLADLHGHRDARHAAAELATEHAALLDHFMLEVQRCFDLAQLMDELKPDVPGAFTGTPSERIARQLAVMLVESSLTNT